MVERFSQRERFILPSGDPMWNEVPRDLRSEYLLMLKDWLGLDFAVVDRAVARACRRPRLDSYEAWDGLKRRLRTLQWFAFYDACEFVHVELRGTLSRGRVEWATPHYEAQLNDLLALHNIKWRMRAGKLERSISPLVDEEIRKVTALLGNERFVAPAMQLQKAIRFLSQRPDPDTGNCVNESLGAVEGVVRIILQDDDVLLSRALRVEPFASAIHPTLREAIEKAYAYRGAITAHGQVVIPSPASVEDAEFVLGLCASTITYLIRKFGSST